MLSGQREARRRRLAVDQQLGVASAQPAQPRRAALHVDARQALEHIAEAQVAVFVQLAAAVEDLGHRVASALGGVGQRLGGDLDLLPVVLAQRRSGHTHADRSSQQTTRTTGAPQLQDAAGHAAMPQRLVCSLAKAAAIALAVAACGAAPRAGAA